MENFYYTDLSSRSALLKKHGFDKEEHRETIKEDYGPTGFPQPLKSYQQTMEAYDLSLEEPYFWILDNFKENFPIIEKLEDSFAASENSAFFGVTQQRLGAQQDKVSQFLATVGKMIKELFQMVRELRILDERLGYYNEAAAQLGKSIGKRSKSSEITLKGIFIDLVQGGAKNAASVFGMSRELQFTTLPDLFFSVHPPTPEDTDEYVDNLEFNDAVKRVLKRKIRSFMEWKKHTNKELKTRKIFTLKYMRQHYDVIYMYLTWIRPYMRNIARLQSEAMETKKLTTPDLVSAFEGSLLEVEYLARKLPEGNQEYYACILSNFVLRSRPDMSFHQEGYRHQGPLHVGKVEVVMRIYAWNDKDVDNYKKLRAAEDFEMVGKIDRSVRDAMQGMGEELQKYLDEAGEDLLLNKEKKEKDKKPKKTILEKTLGTFVTIKPKDKKKKEPKKNSAKIAQEKSNALKQANLIMWMTYKNYKKTHGYLAW